jgi:hypothetical protein
MRPTDKYFDTQDMGLAVSLVCVGFELTELTPSQNSRRLTFRFTSHQAIVSTAQNYWASKLKVDAKQFWNEAKNLKTRLYSQV